MPKFGSFEKRLEEEHPKPKPAPEQIPETKEVPTTVFGKLKERWMSLRDERPTAYNGDELMLEEELQAAGVMSKLERSKLDEEMERGTSHMFSKLSFRNLFGSIGGIKDEWQIASEARSKMYDARDMTELVGEGNMSREEYKEWLKLYGQDDKAGREKMNERLKAKCDELSALGETPEFQSFMDSLKSDPEYRNVYEARIEKAFENYKRGIYGEALRDLRWVFDSHSPWLSYSATPLNRMLKMKKLGLIGDAEMNRVFAKDERNLDHYDSVRKKLSDHMALFNLMEKMTGLGQLSDEERARMIKEAKAEKF